jgi:hypothetical protein
VKLTQEIEYDAVPVTATVLDTFPDGSVDVAVHMLDGPPVVLGLGPRQLAAAFAPLVPAECRLVEDDPGGPFLVSVEVAE